MKYSTQREIGSDCFMIHKNKKAKLSFDELMKDFNYEDYYVLKATSNFRFIELNELEKYAAIVFFKKELYNKDFIQRWLDFTKLMDNKFLNKPFPPEYMLEKIIVVDEI
jgi:hypothetical protein